MCSSLGGVFRFLNNQTWETGFRRPGSHRYKFGPHRIILDPAPTVRPRWRRRLGLSLSNTSSTQVLQSVGKSLASFIQKTSTVVFYSDKTSVFLRYRLDLLPYRALTIVSQHFKFYSSSRNLIEAVKTIVLLPKNPVASSTGTEDVFGSIVLSKVALPHITIITIGDRPRFGCEEKPKSPFSRICT